MASATSDTSEPTTTHRTVMGFPPDEVWNVLIDDDELSWWLGDDVVIETVPGGRGQMTDDDGITRHIRVDEVRPGESIRWHWWPAAEPHQPASEVEITLVPVGDDTEVRVTETVAVMSAAGGPQLSSVRWPDRLISAEMSLLCRQAIVMVS